GVVLPANMLEHAHGDKGVIGSGNVAVIFFYIFDLLIESFLASAFASISDLFVGDIESSHRHAVMPRHVPGQGTPAATGFHDSLAGPQLELAANMIHLGDLSFFQRGCGRGIVSAGVYHLVIKP